MKRSYIWAGLFALAMAGWLASGELMPQLAANNESQTKAEPAKPGGRKRHLFKVQVRKFEARERRTM